MHESSCVTLPTLEIKVKVEDDFMNTICWNYNENVFNHVVELPVKGLNPTITPFLWGWVKYLPSIITFWEILSAHPGLHPTMEIPEKKKETVQTHSVYLRFKGLKYHRA